MSRPLGPRSCGPMDKKIGKAIRLERLIKGRSMEWLAAKARVSYQQIGKWEHGENRVSITMLITISEALGFDFNDFMNRVRGHSESPQDHALENNAAITAQLAVGGALKLLAYYSEMKPQDRRVFLSVAKSMARNDEQQSD